MTEAIVTGDGWLTLGATRFRCAIGRAGLRQHKMEGDEGTPIGTIPLRRILFRADRIRPFPCAVPREPLAPQDGWCDDPQDKAYNTLIRLPHDARHERLWRDDPLYDVIGVLGWNDAPVIPNHGSAIFLHIARPNLAPTEGCIALALPDLIAILAGLTRVRVVGE